MEPFAGKSNFHKYHYAIGRQIHTSDYFYDKYYFQLHAENQFIAQLLVKKLGTMEVDLADLTLVGVNSYSGQLMSQTVSQLKKDGGIANESKQINYALLDYTDKKYSYLFTPELNGNIVIVVPITYTYSRCFDIEDFIKKTGQAFLRTPENEQGISNKVNVIPEFIAVFLIYDTELRLQQIPNDEPLVISKLKKKMTGKKGRLGHLAELYESFGWEKLTKDRIYFSAERPFTGHIGTHLIQFRSELHLGEKCEYCFPASVKNEKVLLPTKSNYDAPNIIFNLPRFKDDFGDINKEQNFHKVFEIAKDSGHLFGHLKFDSNIFLHYIERDRFYENNKEQILAYFDYQIEKVFAKQRSSSEVTFLLITPINLKASKILDDLLEREIFPPTRTTVIFADHRTDFIENFLSNKLPEDLENSIVIYFDYVISGGKNFKLLSDYLKCAREQDHGFDALLTITDRTTHYSKREIIRKLSILGRVTNRFIAFFKLNLPISDPANLGDPIEKSNRHFRQIFRFCNLDGLKLKINQKLKDGKPREFPKLKQDNVDLPPHERMINLMKLRVAHEIGNWLFGFIRDNGGDSREVEFNEEGLEKMIGELINTIQSDNYNFNNEDLTEIIIKTLTHSPFNYYDSIYTATFAYVKNRLYKAITSLKRNGCKFRDEHELQIIRDYLQRAVELNSNFMISKLFFGALKAIFEQPGNIEQKILPEMMTILLFIKQLTFQNPTRSLKLEEIINDPEYLPEPLRNPAMGLVDTLKDRYYLMGRLIKAENSYVLHELKRQFQRDIGNHNVPDDHTDNQINVQGFINEQYLTANANVTNRSIRNFQNFLKCSKEFNWLDKNTIDLKAADVGAAARKMLLTVHKLKHSNAKGDRFIQQTREILQSACEILGPGLEFALCFEYTESDISDKNYRRRRGMADNIYIIRSKDDHNQPFVHRHGLINGMIYGLDDGEPENVQTFIALAKDDQGKFHSFNDTYYSRRGEEKGIPSELGVKEAFARDIRAGHQGIIERDAKMLLLIRLSAVQLEENQGKTGNAVLVISTSKPATTTNFTEFINVEKIRLLLMLKQDLLDYINLQYKNDAFIGWVKDRADLNYKNGMSHMLNKYFAAMDSFWRLPRPLEDRDKTILKFLENKIERHMLAISEQDKQVQVKIKDQQKKGYSTDDLRELFVQLMIVPHIARKPLVENQDFRLEIDVDKGISCYDIVFEQVIPEVMINMRRYSIDFKGNPRIFKITLKDDKLSFQNPYSKRHNEKPDRPKDKGGKAMCDLILDRYMMEPLNQQPLSDDQFLITLDLNTQN